MKNLGVEGTVSGDRYIGGVAGQVSNGGIISNCFSTVKVTGNGFIGSVVGDVTAGSSVSNCYTTGAVNGGSYGYGYGGIAGYVNSGSITYCAALNSSITRPEGDATNFGRIAGINVVSGTFSNNVAWQGMSGFAFGTGETDNIDGEDISIEDIKADGTLGGRFTTANGWTVENGKLPGFGAAVELPEHLK